MDLSDEKVALLAQIFKGILNRRCGNDETAIKDLTEFINNHENSKEYKETL